MGNYDNQSLARGFKILECLGQAGEPLAVAEVARRTGLHRATVHRFLTVLLQLGYVHKNQAEALYTTAFYLHTFGYVENIINTIKHHSRRFLEQLSVEAGGGTVLLGALEGNQIVICDAVGTTSDRDARLRIEHLIGSRRDAHATALGKVLMAYRPVDEIRRRYENHVLHAHARKTIRTRDRLLQVLPHIRRAGYAFEDEEHSDGMRCVAAAIVNPAGRATCAVAVEASLHGMTERTLPHYVECALDAARSIADYMLHSDRSSAGSRAVAPRHLGMA
jgi:DNA-binding IclR family transcriptional regulator